MCHYIPVHPHFHYTHKHTPKHAHTQACTHPSTHTPKHAHTHNAWWTVPTKCEGFVPTKDVFPSDTHNWEFHFVSKINRIVAVLQTLHVASQLLEWLLVHFVPVHNAWLYLVKQLCVCTCVWCVHVCGCVRGCVWVCVCVCVCVCVGVGEWVCVGVFIHVYRCDYSRRQ